MECVSALHHPPLSTLLYISIVPYIGEPFSVPWFIWLRLQDFLSKKLLLRFFLHVLFQIPHYELLFGGSNEPSIWHTNNSYCGPLGYPLHKAKISVCCTEMTETWTLWHLLTTICASWMILGHLLVTSHHWSPHGIKEKEFDIETSTEIWVFDRVGL